MNRISSFVVLALGVFFVTLVGCDTKKVTDAVTSGVDKAKTAVNATVETARQEINLAGSMELSTSPPVSAKACYAKIVITGGERSNVLQLASYKEAELERFPSLFLQAPVKANSPSELAGQTVQAELFAQAAANGTVWHTRTGSPASITVSAVDDKSMTCQCNGATLVNAETGEEATVSGKFVALFE